jgi:membrane protease YdiL (CAAX protease family)
MTPGAFEHGFFALVTLLLPLWALRQHRALVADLGTGRPDARVNAYRRTMALEWSLAILVVVRWGVRGQLPGVLGLGDTGVIWWWVGVVLALAASTLLLFQSIMILRSAERMAQVRAQLEPLRSIVPATAREGRFFSALSVTAGVCEEIVYRGFLIAYLAVFFPLWVAVALSSVIFGLGHAYQGRAGIVKTGLVGLAMAGLFLLTGALWAPILVHAVVDLNSGYLGRKVLGILPTSATPAV